MHTGARQYVRGRDTAAEAGSDQNCYMDVLESRSIKIEKAGVDDCEPRAQGAYPEFFCVEDGGHGHGQSSATSAEEKARETI